MSAAMRRPSRPRSPAFARTVLLFAMVVLSAGAPLRVAAAQASHSMPASLTDHEFWQFFTTMSEDGGSFPSENFVSNETTYQHVIPALQRSLTPGGVYLGVGPEQNFTYIANLKPRMAVIFDIRRQNAMAHLMYKAIFELSPTRADFVSHLFSRPLPARINRSTKAIDLFATALDAKANDSAFAANQQAILDCLMIKHGFALSPEDVQSIKHVYASFFEAGPDINYGYRFGGAAMMPAYTTYAQLQVLTNADGVNMAFLGTEENYQWLRGLHQKNLVVPVVGDFAGQKAIRGVGAWLKQRRATVTAFYLSNVEQYLFRQTGDAAKFYGNVETLPLDSTSTFIRSVPPADGGRFFFGNPGYVGSTVSTNYYSVQVRDSAGMSIIYTTSDSAGRLVTTRAIDSSKTPRPSALEIFRSLRARDDSLLQAQADSARRGGVRDSTSALIKVFGRDTLAPTAFGPTRGFYRVNARVLVSGLASIRGTIDAFGGGRLSDYRDLTGMTKIDGWR